MFHQVTRVAGFFFGAALKDRTFLRSVCSTFFKGDSATLLVFGAFCQGMLGL